MAANNLATLWKARGLYSNAERMYQHVLENRLRVLGPAGELICLSISVSICLCMHVCMHGVLENRLKVLGPAGACIM